VKRTSLPGCLEITAESDDGEIMALCHREFPVYASAVHPESVLTHDGKKILARFLTLLLTAKGRKLTPTLDEFIELA
jgi:anthranilate/para-aminobenzoate synthase component II